ncbi:MAG: TetR/AcrR family transcriptional regulator [Lachnospiraceae bacterium]|nr:TetR/AcrR family transcriptional regulator [Lachnospiraceae bacterium]
MARKETITIDKITDTAFEMAREEGLMGVTARKVAAKAECSTQPIFRVYKNMEELWSAVYIRSVDYFRGFYDLYDKTSDVPFANLGMAYISFAKKEKHLFEILFVSENSFLSKDAKKSMYEILNGKNGNVVVEINAAKTKGCADPSDLFMKLWILIHGAACMCLTGDYDLSDEETLLLLQKSYEAFSKS